MKSNQPILSMNPKGSIEPGLPRLLLTAVCACLLTANPAAAQISVVNTGSAVRASAAGGVAFNINFNAGETADAILLSLSSESNAAAGQVSISYAGFPFTPVIDPSGSQPSVWLLNLSHTTYTGGTATLVLNLTNVTVANGYGLGIVSVKTNNALLDGLGVHASNTSTATSVGLTTTLESFGIAGHYVNLSSLGATAPAPMTQLYGAQIGSARGAAGYRASLAAGTTSFLFGSSSGTNNPRSCAAAFVPVSLVPVLLSTVPADNATEVPIGANLVATFSKPVAAGTGNIELWQAGGGSPLESFDVATPSPRLTFSDALLTIDPTSNLTPGVEYHVRIAATAVVDTGGDAFAGISDSTAWSFTADGTAPTLVSLNPADNAPAFPVASNLVATFSEAVVAGTGNIELWQAGGGSPLESFNVTTSTRLTFSGSTITIDPTADLTPSIGYYMLIASTAVVDTSANGFAGISDPTAWSFTADNTGAIFDDFNDGNDNGWTRQSPLTILGAPADFSFPGGNSYQIKANPQTAGTQFGPARAGSLRLDESYASYFQQSVDIVDWDNSQSATTIGMLARITDPGIGTTNGYSFTITLSGTLEISRITGEAPVSPPVATASIGALNTANDYRLVFTGDGSVLTGQIFNLANLATPIATISGSDATYASGHSGLIVSSSSATQTATATFDNYTSARFGTPIVKADNSTNLALGSSWVGGVAPTSTDRAKWDSMVTGANTTSLGADLTLGGIVIANPAGPVTINPGNTLALGAGLVDIDLSGATQDLTLNCALSMGAPNTWDVTSGRTLALGGVVSGSAGVTKQGAGTALLANANNYTGGTTIAAGTVKLSGAGTLGAAGANVAVSAGALLDLNGTNQSIAFTAGTGVGTVANNAGGGTSVLTLTATSPTNGSFLTIADNTSTPGGNVAVIITTNTQTPSNLNSYTGGTTVNAGAFLYLNSSSPNGAGTGTISLPASGGITATSSGLLVDGATYANDVSGAGYIHNNVNGAGTAVFTGNLNTSGTFNFRNAAAAFEFAGSGNSTLSGVIGPVGASGVFGPNTTVSTGSIIKSGTGTLTLSGNNLYTGTTTVSGGALVLQGGSQRSPITVQDGATLGFDIAAPTTSTKSVTLNTGHKISVSGSPTEPSHTLLTTSSTITGTPNLNPAIPGYTLTVDGGNTLKLVLAPTNTFASWISNPTFGLAPADQDLGDDPDGDGIDNGVENFFGTNPGVSSSGLVAVSASGNTFTFTHPQNATPASDLTAAYTWSKDLANFLANGATDGAGTKVDFTTQPNTPSPGITTVTATVTGTATGKLFVRVNVTQP